MSKPNIADLSVGTKVRVVLEGEVVTVNGNKRVKIGERPRSYGFPAPDLIPPGVVRNAHAVEIVGPKWQPGDVVVVRFTPRGTAYTYVRGMSMWPGERAANKTDAEITAWFGEGKVEHVLRDGKPVVKPSTISAASITAGPIFTDTAIRPSYPRPAPGRIGSSYPF